MEGASLQRTGWCRELASTLFNVLERKSLIKLYKLKARKYRLFTMAFR